MSSFRRHRHRYKSHTHKLSPPAIIAICVAAALIVSIVTGLLLRHFLDEEAYRRLNEKKEPAVTDPVNTYLPDVHAIPFVLGTPIESISPEASRSVALNTRDGIMHYASPVTRYFGMTVDTQATAEDDLIALDIATTYLSGIFHPQALLQETADLQFAVAAQERAVLREFLRNGGSEVLLVVDTLNADTLASTAAYAKALKAEIGTAALGIAVPYALASAENGWEIIGTLLKSCDFCALDLRAVEAEDADAADRVFSDITYYLKQYDMRLMIAEEQSLFTSLLEPWKVSDYAIVSIPLPQEPEPTEPLPQEPEQPQEPEPESAPPTA